MNNGSAPTRRQVRESLIRHLIDIGKIPIDRIGEGACVDAELKMESVAFVEVQIALEEEFDIEIDPIHVLELNEFGAIADYLYDRARTRDA